MRLFLFFCLLISLSHCSPRENCGDNELNHSESSWLNVIEQTKINYLSLQGDTLKGYAVGYTQAESHSVEDRCGTGMTLIGYSNKYSVPGLEFGIYITHDVSPRIIYMTSNGQYDSKDLGQNVHSLTVDSVTYSDVYIVAFTEQVNDTIAPLTVSYSKRKGVLAWTSVGNRTYSLLR